MSNESEPTPETKPKEEAVAKTKKPTRASSKRAKAKKPAVSKSAAATAAKPGRKTPASAAPKAHVARKQTSKADRANILAVADREGLTALQVQKRFGVKPVTYYSWRKANKKRGVTYPVVQSGPLAGVDLAGQVRQTLRAEIARILPALIQSEVALALEVGTSTARRRRK
ncbi:MAG: hypothetical protein IT348_17730 [Candidatus Eisenbacteria bacterium]|nr:hypothetical protein [Candidatus Eisenbacteria bacterium]